MKRPITYCLPVIIALLTPMFEAAAQSPAQTISPRIEAKMLARAEVRVEALKSQLLNLQMKELTLQSRLEDLDYSNSSVLRGRWTSFAMKCARHSKPKRAE